MTIQQAYQQTLAQLYEVYNQREAANIANMVIEHVTGQKKIDRIMYKDMPVTASQEQLLQSVASRLLKHEPIQYVLGEAWFYGMKLYVNEHVLIPRPETEELVDWIVSDHRKDAALSIIDIGTGSGCIPVAIKNTLSIATVSAVDVSEGALSVARKNAAELNAEVNFIQADFLNADEWDKLGQYNIIVSNPPYIRQSEEQTMSPNVLAYEPHLALFVPNENALVFYETIAAFGKTHLLSGGNIYLEINEQLGAAVQELFAKQGYADVELRKDLQGKDRMVKCRKV